MFALSIWYMVAIVARVVYWGIKVIIVLKIAPIFGHAQYTSTLYASAFCLYFSLLLLIISIIMNSNRLFNSEFKYEF